MTTSALKRIALAAMILDHAAQFLPGLPIQFRWIGRISAPIFLFVFVWSIDYTHDKKSFLKRLYVFNAVMCAVDLFFNLLFYDYLEPVDNNIFGTYVALFLLISVINSKENRREQIIKYILLQAVSTFLCVWVYRFPNADAYCIFIAGMSGNLFLNEGRVFLLALGCVLYFFKENKVQSAILYAVVVCLNSLIILSEIVPKLYMRVLMSGSYLLDVLYCRIFGLLGYDVVLFEPPDFLTNEFEWMALFALPLILSYNGKKGRYRKYFYYFFYPCHIAVLLSSRLLLLSA